jgi:hypothetical protein
MKTSFTIFCLWVAIASSKLCAQTALLGDFDFSQGGYTLLIVPLDEGFSDDVDTATVIAYFDDAAHLNAFKAQWVFEQEATQYPFACFNTFTVHVCRAGKAEESIAISRNCHAITSSKGEFAFLGFIPFQGYKLAQRRNHQYSTLQQARTALDSLSQLPNLIYLVPSDWKDFDGEFAFFLEDIKQPREQVYADLKAAMERKYPGEPFEIESFSSSGSSETGWDYYVEVRCRKSLFEKFDLYKVNQNGWQPFPLTLTTYWTK